MDFHDQWLGGNAVEAINGLPSSFLLLSKQELRDPFEIV